MIYGYDEKRESAYGWDEKREPADGDYEDFLALLKLPTKEMASAAKASPPPVVEEGTFGAVIHLVCEGGTPFDGAKKAVPEGGAKKDDCLRSEGAKNAVLCSGGQKEGRIASSESTPAGKKNNNKSKNEKKRRLEGAKNALPGVHNKKDGRRRPESGGARQEQGRRRLSSGKRLNENVAAALEAAARPRASFSATRERSKRKCAPMPTIFEVDAPPISQPRSRSPRSVSVNVAALPRPATGRDRRSTHATKCHRPQPQLRSDAEQYTIGAKDYVPETALLARLRHRHIVKLHRRAMGFVAEKPVETLRDRMREWREAEDFRRVPGVQQLEVAHAIADAMAYLHSKDIVFRNLKPDSVGFDQNGIAKLFNFGEAAELPGRDGANPAGLLYGRCGTMRYMAPEVGLSRGYGPAADAYSFGVLLWELCALARPFASVTSPVAFEKRVFVEGFRPEIDDRWPADVRELVRRCWSAKPSERPSMMDVKVVLSLAIFRLPGEEGGAPARTVRSRLARRSPSHQIISRRF